MASEPDGEQSDPSDNPVNSEVVINWVAIFYEEGKGGENYRETVNLPQQHIDYRHFPFLQST